MGGDDFPDKIQVWRSTATLEYCGTWSTTRYPEDAVTYRRALPAAPAEDVRAGALREAAAIALRHMSKVQLNEPLWHDGQDWAAQRISEAILALIPEQQAALTDGDKT